MSRPQNCFELLQDSNAELTSQSTIPDPVLQFNQQQVGFEDD